MIVALLLIQSMTVPDTRPQRAVPATAFSCAFVRADSSNAAPTRFDLYGTIPAMPEGHDPNASFPMQLGSADSHALAGRGSVNSIEASDWFRDYQISRRVGTVNHVINLKLRRDGRSVAYSTLYDGNWPVDPVTGGEPYRYDAVGLCNADFTVDGATP